MGRGREGREGYGFDAQRYRAWSRAQREWGLRLIGSLRLRGDERILDIGCGDGSLTARLALLVPRGRVLGIDASSSMIQLARGLAGGNLSFQVLDAGRLECQEEFDLAFSNAALHWVRDHPSLLPRVRRALRPGGRARFNFAGEGNCPNLFRVEREEMASHEFARHFEGFEWPWYMPRPGEYAALLRGAGFSRVRVQGQVADRRFSAEELVNWIDQPSIVPLLEHLPDPELRQRFRDRVVARMLRETLRPDGTHLEAFRRLDVRAVR